MWEITGEREERMRRNGLRRKIVWFNIILCLLSAACAVASYYVESLLWIVIGRVTFAFAMITVGYLFMSVKKEKNVQSSFKKLPGAIKAWLTVAGILVAVEMIAIVFCLIQLL